MAFQAHTERTCWLENSSQVDSLEMLGFLQKSGEMEEDNVGMGGEMEEDSMRISDGMWG